MKLRKLLGWGAFLVLLAFGISRLSFDAEVLNLLPDDIPAIRGLKLYQQHFGNARQLIISVETKTAEASSEAARELASLLSRETNLVRGVIWQPPWLERPADAAELSAYLWLNGPPEEFSKLIERLADPALVLAEAQARLATSFSPQEIAGLSYDPYGLLSAGGGASSVQGVDPERLFSSEDGTFRIMFVEPAHELPGYLECEKFMRQIRAITGEWTSTNTNVKLGFTGRPAFVSEISRGMERDMIGSILGTVVLISLIFWVGYRQLRPLLWVVFLLFIILGLTLAVGGALLGTLNVVSTGFAAVLLGLALDYGVVLHTEKAAHPEKSAREVRRTAGSGIFWSAITTAGAFLVLNMGGLPGLGQLGSLVGIGVIIGMLVMMFFALEGGSVRQVNTRAWWVISSRTGWLASAAVAVIIAGSLAGGFPQFDRSPEPLRPKNSPAYDTVDEMKRRMGTPNEPIMLVMRGDEAAINQKLLKVQEALEQGVASGDLTLFNLPSALFPHPEVQAANLAKLDTLLAREDQLKTALLNSGFTTNALFVTKEIFNWWKFAEDKTSLEWPKNALVNWMTGNFAGKTASNDWVVAGLAHVRDAEQAYEWLEPRIGGVADISSWELTGRHLFEHVRDHVGKILIAGSILLFVALWCAFRSMKSVLLSLGTLAMATGILLSVMRLAGWEWNMLNLMALPLLFGAGVDYSIHMQLALKRHNGNVRDAQKTIGKAVLICGISTVAGFGSLALSSNSGLGSLGAVCAIGILSALFTALILLPSWWKAAFARSHAR